MGKVAGLVLLALALSACSNPWAEDRPTETEFNQANWLAPESVALAPRYCYRTLARVDCYDRPLQGAAGRAVGYFDAPLD